MDKRIKILRWLHKLSGRKEYQVSKWWVSVIAWILKPSMFISMLAARVVSPIEYSITINGKKWPIILFEEMIDSDKLYQFKLDGNYVQVYIYERDQCLTGGKY